MTMAAFYFLLILVLAYSIILHEIAHGATALLMGDKTAKEQNRITLNPIPHIDPIGSILLPLIGLFMGGFIIGWAKPVPINPANFRQYNVGLFLVSIAGVATNLLLGVLFCVTFSVLHPMVAEGNLILLLCMKVAYLNLFLGLLNLIPIPPLDGFNVVSSFFPRTMRENLSAIFAQLGFLMLIFALVLISFLAPILNSIILKIMALILS